MALPSRQRLVGGEGWLWKLSCQHSRFNFIGDMTWLKGRVADKREREFGCEVDLEIFCENQRSVITSPGKATVLLPSKRRGAVALPLPKAETLEQAVQQEIDRYAHAR